MTAGRILSHWSLRDFHRASALLIGTFLLLHMGNHLAGLAGQDVHIGYMAQARKFYRQPFVELPLLGLLLWQLGSGLVITVRGWSVRHGAVAWLQVSSGLYLASFLTIHVGAVIGARTMLGLDTDFRFAAAGFFAPPWQWFFAPYYFLSIISLFAHLGCAAYWNIASLSLRRGVLAVCLASGAAFALLVVMSLSGTLYPVDIPLNYLATYGR